MIEDLTIKQIELNKMCDWMNAREFFWIQEFHLHFRIQYEPTTINYSYAHKLIQELKKKNIIQCCEVKSNQRQYVVISKINYKDLAIGKGK